MLTHLDILDTCTEILDILKSDILDFDILGLIQCQDAGISGFKTNHSLRVTNATRLFQHGVDEQLIMTRTGHRSVSGVCTYNRVSDDQKETLSSNLNSTTNATDCPPPQKREEIGLEQTLPHAQTQLFELQSSERDFPTLNLHGYSLITINYTVRK